jgi:hypothetical protein
MMPGGKMQSQKAAQVPLFGIHSSQDQQTVVAKMWRAEESGGDCERLQENLCCWNLLYLEFQCQYLLGTFTVVLQITTEEKWGKDPRIFPLLVMTSNNRLHVHFSYFSIICAVTLKTRNGIAKWHSQRSSFFI